MASNRDRNQTATQHADQSSANIVKCKYDIVPKGDTILTLRNPNAQHYVWHEDPNRLAHLCAIPGEASPPNTNPAGNVPPSKRGWADDSHGPFHSSAQRTVEAPPVRMRLSSSHLKTASAYFEAMFEGPWAENERDPKSSTYSITAENWDESIMVLLMKIAHGRVRDVEAIKDWDCLSRLASLVDYYQCHDVVKFYIQTCLPPTPAPAAYDLHYSRALVQNLAVLCVFKLSSCRDEIAQILSAITRQARGPMQTMGLPIPVTMIGKS